MKTDKIKRIESVKPWSGKHGTTYYHNLEMENGDKINIGKKKEMQVGWEITYEIEEYGQQEYQKSKAVTPEQGFPQKSGSKNVDWDAREKGIRIGHALNNSVQIIAATSKDFSQENLIKYARVILEASDILNNE